MGCCESQFCSRAISKEEMLLEAAERILGLSNISSSEFITTVLQYSRDQYISIGNLNHCFKILNLDTSCFDNPKSLKHWFYRNFYKENSGYSINALVLIGIYLCKGEINEKAQLLFEIYDEKQIKLISYAEFHRLINEIVFLNWALIDLANKYWPNRAFMIEAYSKKIQNSQTLIFNHLHKIMGRGKSQIGIDKLDFIVSFKEKAIQKLISPAGFRELALECYYMNAGTQAL